jgi:hypothetical protein
LTLAFGRQSHSFEKITQVPPAVGAVQILLTIFKLFLFIIQLSIQHTHKKLVQTTISPGMVETLNFFKLLHFNWTVKLDQDRWTGKNRNNSSNSLKGRKGTLRGWVDIICQFSREVKMHISMHNLFIGCAYNRWTDWYNITAWLSTLMNRC